MAGLGFETCVLPRIFALSHYIGAYLDHSPNKNCRHRWVWYVSIDNNGNKIRERVRKCFAIRLSFREHGNLLQPQSMKLPTTPVAVKSFPFVKLGENNHKPIFCFHWIKCANEKKITSAFAFLKHQREELRPPVIMQLKMQMQVTFIRKQRRINRLKQLGCFIKKTRKITIWHTETVGLN